jgi:hypothetical protein
MSLPPLTRPATTKLPVLPVRPNRNARKLLLAAISLALIAGAVWLATPEALWSAFAALPPASVAGALLLILLNHFLAWTRYLATLRAFGARTPAWATFRSFAIGQLAGQFLFNVVGQSVARAASLRVAGAGAGDVVILTFVERALATGVLFAGALAGALLLFGGVGVGGTGLVYPAIVVGTATLATLATLLLLVPRLLGTGAGQRALAVLLRLLPTLPLTVVMHAAMLGAWLLLILPARQGQALDALVAASLIVMFIASVPISFAGWGIREFSAAAIFGHLAMPAEAAVAAGATIGALGLAGTVIEAWVASLPWFRAAGPAGVAADTPGRPSLQQAARDLRAGAATIGGLALALVWFSLRVPLPGGGEVTLNLGDPFALAALGLLGLALYQSRSTAVLPRAVALPVLLVVAVIGGGILLGIARFGPTSWALANRGVGGLVVLGYLAVGPLLVAAGGEAWRRLSIAGFVGNGVLAGAVALAMVFLRPAGLIVDEIAEAQQVQLLMALSAALVLLPAWRQYRTRMLAGGAVLLLLAILSGSRLVLPGLLVIAVVAVLAESRLVLRVLLGMAALALPVWLVLQGPATFAWLSGIDPGLPIAMIPDVVRATNDGERLLSIEGGLALWRQYPLFGAGVGAFMQQRLAAGQPALVIHSVPAWVLGETGLVGFAAFSLLAAGFLVSVRALWSDQWGRRGTALLAALLCFAGFALVHDVLYQRSFWLVAGLLLAHAPRVGREG